MLEETLLWVLAFALVAVMIMALVLPSTRPYMRKFWWVGVGLLCILVAAALLRPKKPGKITAAINDGKKIAEANVAVLDKIADYAEEQKVMADADLARATLESASAREQFDAQVATIGLIEDSLERRKALIKLVGRTK